MGSARRIVALLLLVILTAPSVVPAKPPAAPSKPPTVKPPAAPAPAALAPAPAALTPAPAVAATAAPAAAPSPVRNASGKANPRGRGPAAAPGRPKAAPSPIASAPTLAPGPAPHGTRSVSNGTLDPAQISALEALQVPVPQNPCAGSHSTMICDEGTPFRHLIFLQLQYCAPDAELNEEAMKNLTGLEALSFFDCPMKPSVYLPPDMTSLLTSFSCVSSLGKSAGFEEMQGLSGVWLSKLHKVQDLTVMDVFVNASSLSVIIANMTDLRELKITNSSLRGALPKSWPANLTTIDLSLNNIQGTLPSFFGELQQLQSFTLTGNNISGHVPESLGRLRNLLKLSLSSNRLTGPVPADALVNLTSLSYLDLSGNAFNGSVPESLSSLTDLRYLDLRNNQLKGILPFNSSFIARLNSFKASGNPQLCFNSSRTSAKMIVGISPCDENGNPISSVAPALSPGEDLAPNPEPEQGHKTKKRRGPKTIVWAVATALGAIFLFIALVVVFSKFCRWKEA